MARASSSTTLSSGIETANTATRIVVMLTSSASNAPPASTIRTASQPGASRPTATPVDSTAIVARFLLKTFRKVFSRNLATIAVLSTGVAVGLLAPGWLAVRIVLAGGAFDAEDVSITTILVAVFAVSIPLESVVELLARAIYATKNTL